MRTKSLLLLMLALGCGLVASLGITQVMGKRNANGPNPTGEMTAIFVAMENVPMGDPLTAQVLKLEEWPKNNVPPGALTKIEDVEGRRPKTPIYKGSPILEDQLLGQGAAEEGAGGLIPTGYRVVSIKVDSVSGGASLIRPGDRVDLLVHLQSNPSKGIHETTTRTILQDIKVFAVNDVFNLQSVEGEKSISAKTISLLVTPGQAEKVMLATELGNIRMVLRSPQDDEQTTVAGAVPHELFGNSEASERENETRIHGPQLARKTDTDDLDTFRRMLESQEAEKPVRSEEGPGEADNWKMRIISADRVNEVLLETDREASSPQASVPGFSFWRLISSVGSAKADGSPVAPDTGTAGEDQEQDETKPETAEGPEIDP